MKAQRKKYLEIDLTPYQPFGLGISILVFLSSLAAIALIAIGIYEWAL